MSLAYEPGIPFRHSFNIFENNLSNLNTLLSMAGQSILDQI